jgi:hypothetical protein
MRQDQLTYFADTVGHGIAFAPSHARPASKKQRWTFMSERHSGMWQESTPMKAASALCSTPSSYKTTSTHLSARLPPLSSCTRPEVEKALGEAKSEIQRLQDQLGIQNGRGPVSASSSRQHWDGKGSLAPLTPRTSRASGGPTPAANDTKSDGRLGPTADRVFVAPSPPRTRGAPGHLPSKRELQWRVRPAAPGDVTSGQHQILSELLAAQFKPTQQSANVRLPSRARVPREATSVTDFARRGGFQPLGHGYCI